MSEPVVIAIDGPAGSGKSTVAEAVARRLGYRHLDTGAMYRAVTVLALRAGAIGDDDATAKLAEDMELQVNSTVAVNGEDVTAAIRAPEVDAAVSVVAANPAVRRSLVQRQRAWVDGAEGAVVEGRDIGTVVFPGARLKVYLTADPEERARRRVRQLADAGTAAPPVAEAGDTAALLQRRDRLDSSRQASPLVVAEDAVVLDTTGRPVEDVIEEVLSYL